MLKNQLKIFKFLLIFLLGNLWAFSSFAKTDYFKQEDEYLLAKSHFESSQYQKAYEILKDDIKINVNYGDFDFEPWFSHVRKVLELKVQVKKKLNLKTDFQEKKLKVISSLDEEVNLSDINLLKQRVQILHRERRWTHLSKYSQISESEDCQLKFQFAKATYFIGRKDEALKLFQKISKKCIAPYDVNSLYWEGLILRRKNFFTKAIPVYKKLYQHPQSHHLKDDALYYLIQIYENKKNIEKKFEYEKILKSLPSGDLQEKYLWDLAFEDYLDGKYESSLNQIRELKKISSSNPEFYPKLLYWESEILSKQKKFEKSNISRKEIIRNYPFSYYAVLVRALIKGHYLHIPLKEFEEVHLGSDHPLKEIDDFLSKLFLEKKYKEISNWIYYFHYYYPKLVQDEKLYFSWRWNQIHNYYLGLIFFSDHYKLGTHDYLDKEDLSYHALYYPRAFEKEVLKISKEVDLPVYQIWGISREESLFRTGVFSSVGARGLMQLMPATAKEQARMIGIKNFKLKQLDDPQINLKIGASYFKRLNRSRSLALSIMSYNAGPTWVRRWLKKDGDLSVAEFIEKIPFGETRKYTKRVLRSMAFYQYMEKNKTDEEIDPLIYPIRKVSEKYNSQSR